MNNKFSQQSFQIDYSDNSPKKKKDEKKEQKEISQQVLDHPFIVKLCEHLNVFTAMALCLASVFLVLLIGGILFIWPITQNYFSTQKKIKKNQSQIRIYKISKKNIEKNEQKDLNNPLAVYKNSTKQLFLSHQSKLFDFYALQVNQASFKEKSSDTKAAPNQNARRPNRRPLPTRKVVKASNNNKDVLDFKSYDYHLNLSGDYLQIGRFLEDMYHSNLLCVVKNFTLEEAEESGGLVLDINMEVNIYVDV